jgi:hypothetical protein
MSPEELGTNNHLAGEDQQQIWSQSIGRVVCVCVGVYVEEKTS